jgi:hypothetical protein
MAIHGDPIDENLREIVAQGLASDPRYGGVRQTGGPQGHSCGWRGVDHDEMSSRSRGIALVVLPFDDWGTHTRSPQTDLLPS